MVNYLFSNSYMSYCRQNHTWSIVLGVRGWVEFRCKKYIRPYVCVDTVYSSVETWIFNYLNLYCAIFIIVFFNAVYDQNPIACLFYVNMSTFIFGFKTDQNTVKSILWQRPYVIDFSILFLERHTTTWINKVDIVRTIRPSQPKKELFSWKCRK